MNMMFILIGLACFGLIFGSFVNALVWRIKKKRNWVTERSECTHCHHELAPADLIPVLSYILLRGKCRYCHKKIEDSPITEVVTSLLFVVSYLCWPLTFTGAGLFQFICWLILLVAFMALAVYDLRWFLLPNKIVYPVIVFTIIKTLALPVFYHHGWSEAGASALAAIVLSGIFYILFAVSDGTWIGGGDVKLAVALGLLAGDPLRATFVLFLAAFTGIAVAIPEMLHTKGGALKLKIPFGPFLIFGTFIVQIFGTAITQWYLHLLSV